jgi:hypothetical protein
MTNLVGLLGSQEDASVFEAFSSFGVERDDRGGFSICSERLLNVAWDEGVGPVFRLVVPWMYRPDRPAVILAPELVPRPLWGSSVRTQVGAKEWNRISRDVRSWTGFRCSLCGSGDRTHADERWRYSTGGARPVFELVSIWPLCALCHEAKHLGRADAHGHLKRAKERLKWLNGWSSSELESVVIRSARRYDDLSKFEGWVMSWSWDHVYAFEKGIEIGEYACCEA